MLLVLVVITKFVEVALNSDETASGDAKVDVKEPEATSAAVQEANAIAAAAAEKAAVEAGNAKSATAIPMVYQISNQGMPFLSSSMQHMYPPGGMNFGQVQSGTIINGQFVPLPGSNQQIPPFGMFNQSSQSQFGALNSMQGILGQGMGFNQGLLGQNMRLPQLQLDDDFLHTGELPKPSTMIKVNADSEQATGDMKEQSLAKKKKRKMKASKLKKLHYFLEKIVKIKAHRITKANRAKGRGYAVDKAVLSTERDLDKFIYKIVIRIKNEFRMKKMREIGRKIPSAYVYERDEKICDLIDKGVNLIQDFIDKYDDLVDEDISMNSLDSESEASYSQSADNSYSMSTTVRDDGDDDSPKAKAEPTGLVVPPRKPASTGLAVPVLPRRDPKMSIPIEVKASDPKQNVRSKSIKDSSPPGLAIPAFNKQSVKQQADGKKTVDKPIVKLDTGKDVGKDAGKDAGKKSGPAQDKKNTLPSEDLIFVDPAKKAVGAKTTDAKTTKEKPAAKLATEAVVAQKDSTVAKKKEVVEPAPSSVIPSIGDFMKMAIPSMLAGQTEEEIDKANQLESERIIDEFVAENPDVIVFLEKCLKNSKNAIKLQEESKLKKSIERDETGVVRKRSKRKTLGIPKIGEDTMVSEMYDDTFMQEVSINIIPPSMTDLPKEWDDDDKFRMKNKKNRLLPKKAKGRRRAN